MANIEVDENDIGYQRATIEDDIVALRWEIEALKQRPIQCIADIEDVKEDIKTAEEQIIWYEGKLERL